MIIHRITLVLDDIAEVYERAKLRPGVREAISSYPITGGIFY